MHGGEFIHPNRVMFETKESVEQFLLAQQKNDEEVETESHEEAKWKPPTQGRCKVNWDIAVDNQNCCMGVGAILRDDEGRVLAAVSKTLRFCYEPVAGEAVAALYAAEFTRDLGFYDVDFEGDSLQIVNAIRNNDENCSRYGHVIDDIKTVLEQFRSWRVSRVRRICNSAARLGILWIECGLKKFLIVFMTLSW